MDLRQALVELQKRGLQDYAALLFASQVRREPFLAPLKYGLAYYDFLREHRVKSVLEVGSFHGMTAILAALAGAEVISIDISPFQQELAKYLTGDCFRILWIAADSREILPLIASRRVEAVLVDGAHDVSTARADIREALRVARRFVLVHDTDNPKTPSVRAVLLQEIKEPWQVKVELPHSQAPWGLTILEKAGGS